MNRRVSRRAAIVGGVAAVAAIAAATAGRTLLAGAPSPEAEEAAYANLLAEVHDDYVNGRVVEHQGWVLSQHEFDSIGARQGQRPGRSALS